MPPPTWNAPVVELEGVVPRELVSGEKCANPPPTLTNGVRTGTENFSLNPGVKNIDEKDWKTFVLPGRRVA